MRFPLALVAAVALFGATASCSTNSTAPTADAGMPCVDSGGSPPTPSPDKCATPGTPGNEKGIGAYCIGYPCQPGSVACPTIDGGPELFCAWDGFSDYQGNPFTFCFSLCTNVGQCGSGASCVQGNGSPCPGGPNPVCACVPDRCLLHVADASVGDALAE